jgi:predicted dehydrogenase
MEPMPIRRRSFTAATAATTLALSTAPARALGVNERIRLGFIGVGNRGSQLLDAFLKHSDMDVVALCDVFEPYLARANEKLARKAETYGDFRKLLERTDLDAVVIATPDHWHAIQTIAACDAGKDVYCEKPLSITIHEGRRMVEAARRNNRITQVGTHRRSSRMYTDLASQVQAGKIGKITVSRAYAPYKFRWWDLYSSQVANWGVHYLDAIRWLTGDLAPSSVCAMGGRYAIDDDRTIPDTLEVTFEFASGRLAVFGQYEASGNSALRRGEVELRGTEGTLYISDRGYEIVPERGGQFQKPAPRMKPVQQSIDQGEGDMTVAHARNFLDCMRSRKPANADIEIGHRSTTMSLLANISLATRSRLEWDAQQERITNNSEANNLLHYEYRQPWKLG